ncbi:MAG: FAD-dependent oxidoreductase [Phycisphaerales bacterium]|nr:FAD-dependent oxidoreductase [Planctomycetota bacterium]MCH8508678.1 FAD-dependent oxidoreductase [Phycisphaerales bacterium]
MIGAGVVGLACALELGRRGLRVTVVDRGLAGHGASFGNAGWLTPSLAFPLAQPGYAFKAARWMLDPESPFYIRPSLEPAMLRWLAVFLLSSRRSRFRANAPALIELCRWSVDAWERLAAADGPGFDFARHGLLMVLETEKGRASAQRSASYTESLGIPWESWDAERVRAEEPIVIGPQIGAVYFPHDAHCVPNLAVERLRAEAKRAGVRVIEGRSVDGFHADRGGIRALRTDRGEIEAERFVLAAGFWSGGLGKELGLKIPMRAAKGYSIQFHRSAIHPERSIYLAERKVTVTPHADRLRLAGTLEVVGEDLSINERRVGAIERGARAMLDLPAERAEAAPWAGLRPCLADGMPAIGASPKHRNLWLAIGHQMTGLKCAPGTARLLAELMSGERPSFDPRPFDPERCCR